MVVSLIVLVFHFGCLLLLSLCLITFVSLIVVVSNYFCLFNCLYGSWCFDVSGCWSDFVFVDGIVMEEQKARVSKHANLITLYRFMVYQTTDILRKESPVSAF